VPYVPVPNNGSLSHIGPLARDVADAALMLSVMSGLHPADLTSQPVPFTPSAAARPLAGLRIAYSPDLGHARVDADVASCVAIAARRLEALGCHVTEVTPPWGASGPDLIRLLWGPPLLAQVPADKALWSDLDQGLVACLGDAEAVTLAASTRAQGRRLAYAAAVGEWFAGGWDLLLTPAASVAAFPVGRQRPAHWPEHAWDWLVWAEFSYPFNFSHGPAVSIPCGPNAEGLPVGMQLAGPRHADRLVLDVAAAYLAAHPPRPPKPGP
jgi:aspartyl-tRNA(Asn)/glutamyl-tRNA(Gln) amidotransferase subunit A